MGIYYQVRAGIEPTWKNLQFSALPLCYLTPIPLGFEPFLLFCCEYGVQVGSFTIKYSNITITNITLISYFYSSRLEGPTLDYE